MIYVFMPAALFPAVVFSSPWILWGLLLAVVPLAIQLFFRPRYRDEPWGAMQFLDAAFRQQRQRMQFEQWLQLLLRTLLIVALVLAMAQPRPEDRSLNASSDSSVHWILVWDSSLSMRAITGTESAFERGRVRLLELIDRAPPGSSFRLVRPSTHHERLLVPQPLFDPDAIRLELELLQPTLDSNSWPAALRDVLTLLPSSPAGHTEVVIVSDFQQRDWSSSASQQEQLHRLFLELDRQAGITLLDVGAPVENCSITRLEIQRNPANSSSAHEVGVSLANHGDQPATLEVDLLIDDVPYARQTLTLAAGEEGSHRFPLSLFEPGEHSISARLPDDALSEDNQRSIILNVTTLHRLLVVQSPAARSRRQPADYLQLVFPAASQGFSVAPANGETHFELDVVAPQDLAARTFYSYSTILLCNVGELPLATIRRLEQFVRLGGGLVIAPGERSLQSETGRRLLESTLVGATQLELVTSAAADATPYLFRPRQPDHPVIAPFRDRPEAGLSTTRIYNYVKLALTAPEIWDTVVDYNTGDAALLTRQFGRGRIALLTTSLDDSWSSWPLWPSFVPMLRELERYISAGRSERAQLTVGDTWTLPALSSPEDAPAAEAAGLVTAQASAALSITDPAQRTRTVDLSNTDMEWTFSQTLQPGIYTVNSPSLNERFAVNIDPAEGATQRISIDTMKEGVLKNLSMHTQLVGDTSSLNTVPSSHEFELVFFLLLTGVSLWLAELLLQRHAGSSSLLLLSLLEVSLLLGPEAGLLRLATVMIMLMAGQGALLTLWQYRRVARASG